MYVKDVRRYIGLYLQFFCSFEIKPMKEAEEEKELT